MELLCFITYKISDNYFSQIERLGLILSNLIIWEEIAKFKIKIC